MLVFEGGGKPENLNKNPRSEDENQLQTRPTWDRSGNRTRTTAGYKWQGNKFPYETFFIYFIKELDCFCTTLIFPLATSVPVFETCDKFTFVMYFCVKVCKTDCFRCRCLVPFLFASSPSGLEI